MELSTRPLDPATLLPSAKILLTDDNATVQYVISHILRQDGYEVIQAETGKRALEMMNENPDLVILDVNLPDISGFEICRRIKSNPAYSSVPVMHLSASHTTSQSMVSGLEGGADAFLTQPVDASVLLATVKALLRVRRAEQSLREANDQLANIYAGMSEGIIVANLNRRVILRVNPAACSLFGYSESEMIGMSIDRLTQQGQEELAFDGLKNPVAGWNLDIECRRKSGELFIANASGTTTLVQGQPCAVLILRDVTEPRRAEQALRASEARYRQIVETSEEGIWVFDQKGNTIQVNDRMCEILGYPAETIYSRPAIEFLYPGDRQIVRDVINGQRSDSRGCYEVRLVRKDETVIWVMAAVAPMLDEAGNYISTLAMITDIHERVRREHEIQAMYTATSVLLSTLDLNELFERVLQSLMDVIPEATCAVAGYLDDHAGQLQARAVVGEPLTPIELGKELKITGAVKTAFVDGMPVLFQREKSEQIPPHNYGSQMAVPLEVDGYVVGVLLVYSVKAEAFGAAQLRLLSAYSAAARAAIHNAQMHQQVQELAITDPLTGLYNRRGLEALGRHQMELSRRYNRPVAMIFFDIDFFKQINDQFGHSAGDNTLAMMAAITRRTLRQVDLVTRFGGEEFVCLLPETDIEKAVLVADRLRQALSVIEVGMGNVTAPVTISMGVVSCEGGQMTLEQLIEEADKAMYMAKTNGRNRIYSKNGFIVPG